MLVYAGTDPLTGKPNYLTESTRDEAQAQKILTRLLAQVDEQRNPRTKATLSAVRICADLDAEVGAFRDRSLADRQFPYVFLEATYCKARVNRRVVSQVVVIATGVRATGVRADGWREVLCRTAQPVGRWSRSALQPMLAR